MKGEDGQYFTHDTAARFGQPKRLSIFFTPQAHLLHPPFISQLNFTAGADPVLRRAGDLLTESTSSGRRALFRHSSKCIPEQSQLFHCRHCGGHVPAAVDSCGRSVGRDGSRLRRTWLGELRLALVSEIFRRVSLGHVWQPGRGFHAGAVLLLFRKRGSAFKRRCGPLRRRCCEKLQGILPAFCFMYLT